MSKKKGKFDLGRLVHDGIVNDGQKLFFVSDPAKFCKVQKQPNGEFKVVTHEGVTTTVHAFAQQCLGAEPPDHATRWYLNTLHFSVLIYRGIWIEWRILIQKLTVGLLRNHFLTCQFHPSVSIKSSVPSLIRGAIYYPIRNSMILHYSSSTKCAGGRASVDRCIRPSVGPSCMQNERTRMRTNKVNNRTGRTGRNEQRTNEPQARHFVRKTNSSSVR